MLSILWKKSGFTLVEFVVVMAILIILVTIGALLLDPGELVLQTRDSTRFNDLKKLNDALLFANTSAPTLVFGLVAKKVYISLPSTDADFTEDCRNDYPLLPALTSGWQYLCASNTANLRKVDGNGWLPVNFSSISTAAHFSVLPVDPVNDGTTGNFYAYGHEFGPYSYALSSKVDSEKYLLGIAANDGGNDNTSFETAPTPW